MLHLGADRAPATIALEMDVLTPLRNSRRFLLLALVAWCLSGCANLMGRVGSGLGDNLSAGILSQDDPETVAEGLPAYLLLLDGFIEGNPKNAELLAAGSKLYGAYAGSFVQDPERRKRLAARSEDYGQRAVCLRSAALCDVLAAPFDRFEAEVARSKDAPLLHLLASAWVTRLQASTDDMAQIARLPAIQVLFERVEALDPAFDNGSAHMYLGVLDCLRSESLGGQPMRGVKRLDEAAAYGSARALMPKVLQAQFCARLLFDRERHDRLLNEVLAADARAPGLTLMNTLAQRQAKALLADGANYFE